MSQEARKVSFKNVGATAPVVDAATGEVEKPQQTPDVSAAIAPRTESAVTAYSGGSYFGGEDEMDTEDIKFPYVNLVQPTSKSPLIEHGVGNYVLAKDTKLGTSFKAIVVGFSKPRYEEKVKWGAPAGKRFSTIEEVDASGGTARWEDSRENRDGNSKKPFFDTQRTVLLLVEKPEGVDDARFGTLVDGKSFAIALFVAKGMGYNPVYINLNSEQKNGTLREGFYSRFVEFGVQKASATSEAVKPSTKVLEKVSDALKTKALQLRS